jgi:pimeloyl-ACP methyl ester carboxylesterase
MRPEPFVRVAGAGPAVVCIHANAGTSGQWRALMDLLTPTHRVLAPDCYGSGRSADWPSDRVIALKDEVEFLAPVFARAGESFSLVGHSYGAAVALIAALAHRERVRSLALYEPTLFALIEADAALPNEADGIRHAVADAGAALDRVDADAAAERFIDYWMGAGSWRATPPERKPPIAASVKNIRRWAHALFTEPTPLAAFATLDMPALIMTGGASTVAAHGVSRRLLSVLPAAAHHGFPKLGHMGPVTHAEQVNAVLARFLGGAGGT